MKHGMRDSDCHAEQSEASRSGENVSPNMVAHEKNPVTESLNQVYDGEPSSLDPAIAKMQAASMGGKEWIALRAKRSRVASNLRFGDCFVA